MDQIFKFAIGLAAGSTLAYIYENLPLRKLFKRNALIVRGYKLHHSLYGAILIILSFILTTDLETKLLLLSLGVGVIVEHYFTGGGFDFVTKEKS